MMSAPMMWQCGLHFGVTLWQVRQALCTSHMPLHVTWPRRGIQLLLCATVVVGFNVLGRIPILSGSNGPICLSVGSTWCRSSLVLVFVLCLTACVMSNGGSSARYVTKKSSRLEGSWQWLPKCCMLLTRGKACG